MFVEQIQLGNKALRFIDARLRSDQYRGGKSSQHNRYDRESIHIMLGLLDKYAPDSALLKIRTTDLSKRTENYPDEITYARFCDELCSVLQKWGQDALRKNIFLDMHRMGFIERYNDKKEKLDPYKRAHKVSYVALSEEGRRFVREDNILNQQFMYSKAIDKLLGGYIQTLLNLLQTSEYHLKYITKYEFMFFVSAVDVEAEFNISLDQCVDFIHCYRKTLSRVQQRGVIETLKQKLKPQFFLGDKTAKRDWGNWQNKIDQAFTLFSQTVYFDLRGEHKERVYLKTGCYTKDGKKIVEFQNRSIAEKFTYFDEHHVDKKQGYELHHIMPLAWAESAEQYKIFDTWKNMVYIDAYSHAKITQNRSRNIIVQTQGPNILLNDFSGSCVALRPNREILYDVSKQDLIVQYNQRLLETV